MLRRYSIWDKVSPVITPSGKIFTAQEWIEKYPVAELDSITVVGSAGEVNGGFFGTLGQMMTMYTDEGVDFTGCETDEARLELIEAFEDYRNTPVQSDENTPEERIAAALELQNIIAMPDVNTDDPDAVV